MKILWIEEYHCGCSSEAARKRDLLGWCATHGDSRRDVYKIPIGKAAKKIKEMMEKSEKP